MLKTEFISIGSDLNLAVEIACELTAKIYLEEDNYLSTKWIDLKCNTLEQAESLNKEMWNKPANILLPHQLIHAGDSKVRINIGYPGTKFDKDEDRSLINLSPDFPSNIKHYNCYYQMVIEDGSVLREEAAKTWKQAKKEGLEPEFKKWR
jgi:DNA polymerase IIIc chi subunit